MVQNTKTSRLGPSLGFVYHTLLGNEFIAGLGANDAQQPLDLIVLCDRHPGYVSTLERFLRCCVGARAVGVIVGDRQQAR